MQIIGCGESGQLVAWTVPSSFEDDAVPYVPLVHLSLLCEIHSALSYRVTVQLQKTQAVSNAQSAPRLSPVESGKAALAQGSDVKLIELDQLWSTSNAVVQTFGCEDVRIDAFASAHVC